LKEQNGEWLALLGEKKQNEPWRFSAEDFFESVFA
jgi:hypothetical protein